jgi:hypothetical protein
VTLPDNILPGNGNNPTEDSAVTDFPDPLSPTIAMTVFSSIARLTPLTA